MKKNTSSGTVRIIAGEWRSRKLPVADVPGLRPSTDRVRETVFNWLQHAVIQAECLDLFAGTGAFGFEAASRGAKEVTMLEINTQALSGLKQSVELLKTNKIRVQHGDALKWLSMTTQAFDIIFVDPPFDKNLSSQTLKALNDSACLKSGSLIYLEEAKQAIKTVIPDNMEMLKEGKTSHVRYALFKVS